MRTSKTSVSHNDMFRVGIELARFRVTALASEYFCTEKQCTYAMGFHCRFSADITSLVSNY